MTLKEDREAIAAALTAAGVRSWAYVPESPVAPCGIVQPGSPYLTTDNAVFGEYQTRYLVSLLTRPGTNEKVTNDLDEMIATACGALNVVEVSEPFGLEYNTAQYLAVNLTVTASIHIE